MKSSLFQSLERISHYHYIITFFLNSFSLSLPLFPSFFLCPCWPVLLHCIYCGLVLQYSIIYHCGRLCSSSGSKQREAIVTSAPQNKTITTFEDITIISCADVMIIRNLRWGVLGGWGWISGMTFIYLFSIDRISVIIKPDIRFLPLTFCIFILLYKENM